MQDALMRTLHIRRRASLQVVNIGNINDPEKTKAAKEKKATVCFL